MRKRYALFGLAVAAVAAAVSSYAVAGTGQTGPVIKALGGEYFKVNKVGGEDFRFAPATIRVHTGESITFKKAEMSPEPHTLTIALKSQLPHSFESCKVPCNIALGHLKNPKDPQNSPIKTFVLDKGQPGLDTVGDSIAVTPKHKSETIVVSAPAGTTLYYICAVHPWMQGKIFVTG